MCATWIRRLLIVLVVGLHTFEITIPPRLLAPTTYLLTVTSVIRFVGVVDQHDACCEFVLRDLSSCTTSIIDRSCVLGAYFPGTTRVSAWPIEMDRQGRDLARRPSVDLFRWILPTERKRLSNHTDSYRSPFPSGYFRLGWPLEVLPDEMDSYHHKYGHATGLQDFGLAAHFGASMTSNILPDPPLSIGDLSPGWPLDAFPNGIVSYVADMADQLPRMGHGAIVVAARVAKHEPDQPIYDLEQARGSQGVGRRILEYVRLPDFTPTDTNSPGLPHVNRGG